LNEQFDELFERTLPTFLRDDIIAFEEGIKNNSTLLDCLYCEVQGSINAAFYGNQITQAEADFLRKKHLGLERQTYPTQEER
jgi:hypothetical protein